jgi:hypothetical protein
VLVSEIRHPDPSDARSQSFVGIEHWHFDCDGAVSMAREILTRAVEAADRIVAATRAREFERSVQDFVRVLHTVPDSAVIEWSDEASRWLRTMADEVVDQIDEHLDAGDGRAALERRLAAAIYEIRAAVEEADRWYRHYARR